MFKEQNSPFDNIHLIKKNHDLIKDRSFLFFFEKVHSKSGLYVISSVFQIFLGFCVVALTVLGAITPVWLATIMTIFGSITTMIGIYMLHQLVSVPNAFDSLINKAIKRAITSQN